MLLTDRHGCSGGLFQNAYLLYCLRKRNCIRTHSEQQQTKV